MSDNPLKKETVRHWMYSVLGLRTIVKGLKTLVTTKLNSFHLDMKQNVETACGISMYNCQTCTMDTLSINHNGMCPHKCKRNCLCTLRTGGIRVTCKQNNACGQMYELIIKEHVANSPNWGQTDVAKWSTDPFAVATCFTSSRNGLKDFEITSLIELCMNIKQINKGFGKSTQDLLLTVKQIRNDVFHNEKMEISENQMYKYLGQMKTFLDSLSSSCTEKEKGLGHARTEIDELLAGKWFPVDPELKDVCFEIRRAFSDDIQSLEDRIESKSTQKELEVINNSMELLKKTFNQQTASHAAQYTCISKREDSLEQEIRSLNRKVTEHENSIEIMQRNIVGLQQFLKIPILKKLEGTVELSMELSDAPDDRHEELRFKPGSKVEMTDYLSTGMSEKKNVVEAESKVLDSSPEVKIHTLEEMKNTHSAATRLLYNIESSKEVNCKDVKVHKDDHGHLMIESVVIYKQFMCHRALGPNITTLQLKDVKVTQNIMHFARSNAFQAVCILLLNNIRLSHAEIASLLCDIPTIKRVSFQKVTTFHDKECTCERGSMNKLQMKNVQYLEVQDSKGVVNLIESAAQLQELHLHHWDSVKKILKITIRSYLLQHVWIDVDQISHTAATDLLCSIESLQYLAIHANACVIDQRCGCKTRSSRKIEGCKMRSLLVPKNLHVNSVACLTHVKDAHSLEKLTVDVPAFKQYEAWILARLLEKTRSLSYLTFNGTKCSIQSLTRILHSLRANKATVHIKLMDVVVTSATDFALLMEDSSPFDLKGHKMAADKAADGGKPRLRIEEATISYDPMKARQAKQ